MTFFLLKNFLGENPICFFELEKLAQLFQELEK